jgi:hypothetical protein
MNLKAFQKQFQEIPNGPKTALESLDGLQACCEKAREMLEKGYNPTVQTFLEQGLTYLMKAYHYLNLDLECVAEREKTRWLSQSQSQQRVILVFSDHAELRVDGQLRGTIPLYTSEDYEELRSIAHLFNCRIENSDATQLGLFEAMNLPKAG